MEIEEAVEDNVNDDIAKAMEELETHEEPAVEAEEPAVEAEEPAVETPEEPAVEAETEEPKEVEEAVEPAPNSWPKNMAEKWAGYDQETRAFLLKREEDQHKMATNQDQDRLFGRDLKEVINPYMPAIQQAGGTPKGVIQNALNSMYTLHSGTQAQKQAAVRDIIQTYGVEMQGLEEGMEYVDPTIKTLQDEIRKLQAASDPNVVDQRLTQKMEHVRINSEIEAFASDPANTYFEQVKPAMVALLNAGSSNTLKEAYEAACRADPTIHSTLEAKKQADLQAQRKAEIAAKKKAASSVVGSPATSNPQPKTNPNADVYDDVREAMNSLSTQL